MINNSELMDIKYTLANETGFVCYEDSSNNQLTFYGTSDKFEAFKTIVGNKLNTGTVVYCIDNGSAYMYSAFKNTWY